MKLFLKLLLFSLCGLTSINSFASEGQVHSKDVSHTQEERAQSEESSSSSSSSLPAHIYSEHSSCGSDDYQTTWSAHHLPKPQSYPLILKPELVEQAIRSCPQEIKEIIAILNRVKQRKNYTNMPKKLLLVGPPGAGKTTIAGTIAQQSHLQCFVYKSSLIADQYKNSGDKNLEAIFNEIKALAQQEPVIIFIDELQELIKKDKNEKDSDNSMITSLWSLLDTCDEYPILFIGAFNYVDKLPEQFLSRQDEIVTIELPNKQQREESIKFHIGQQQDKDLNLKTLSIAALAERTEGCSHRDLAHILSKAIRRAYARGETITVVTLDDCFKAQNAKRSWTRKTQDPSKNTWKFTLKEYAIKAAPYIFTVGITAISMYWQWKISNWQLARQDAGLELQRQSLEAAKDGTRVARDSFAEQKSMNADTRISTAASQKTHNDSFALQQKTATEQAAMNDFTRESAILHATAHSAHIRSDLSQYPSTFIDHMPDHSDQMHGKVQGYDYIKHENALRALANNTVANDRK